MFSTIKREIREIRSALWFRPATLCFGVIIVAVLIAAIDRHVPASAVEWLPEIETATVLDLLRLLAGTMLTVATVTLSVLMLVLSLAAGQASPRTVPELMADGVTQNALGTFLSAFVYSLSSLLLFGMGAITGPGIPLTFIGALFLVAMAVRYLVQWIHHVADTLKLNKVIERVYKQSDSVLRAYLDTDGSTTPAAEPSNDETGIDIFPTDAGYVQLVDIDALDGFAAEHDLQIRLAVREGSFVQPQVPIMTVVGDSANDRKSNAQLRSALVIGSERSPASDPLLGFELLTEIASRALSPGVNDPQTALICIDYLGSLLAGASMVAARDYPPSTSKNGRVLLIRSQFDNMLERAFRPLLRDAANSAEVLSAIMNTLTIIARVSRAEYLDLIRAEGQRVLDYGLAGLHLDADKNDLRHAADTLDRLVPAGIESTSSAGSDGVNRPMD